MTSYLIQCAVSWAYSNRADAYDDPCDDCVGWCSLL